MIRVNHLYPIKKNLKLSLWILVMQMKLKMDAARSGGNSRHKPSANIFVPSKSGASRDAKTKWGKAMGK